MIPNNNTIIFPVASLSMHDSCRVYFCSSSSTSAQLLSSFRRHNCSGLVCLCKRDTRFIWNHSADATRPSSCIRRRLIFNRILRFLMETIDCRFCTKKTGEESNVVTRAGDRRTFGSERDVSHNSKTILHAVYAKFLEFAVSRHFLLRFSVRKSTINQTTMERIY